METPPAHTWSRESLLLIWHGVMNVCRSCTWPFLLHPCCCCCSICRAATAAYDRNLVCNGHPDAETCVKDKSNRCFFWNKSCVGLDAYEVCVANSWVRTAAFCNVGLHLQTVY